MWSVLERLDVVGVIDEIAPRYPNAGASIGTYIALATANRVVAPCSKLAFADWWATTAGPRWVKTPAGSLDHRRFWDAMDRLDTEDYARSRPSWDSGWSPSSGWTCRDWCWT